MKIAFLISNLEAPSSRYRVLQYLPYLKNKRVDVSVHFYKQRWLDKLKFYNTLRQYHILYIHRKLFSPIEFWYIRRKAKKIIYDFDDAVMYKSSGSKTPYSLSRRMKFGYMMKRVDFVVPGNQFLKLEVLSYNANVAVIPTAIDLSKYALKELFHSEGPITIGWLGSSSTLKYLKTIMPIMENLYQKCPHFLVKIVCDQFLDSFKIPVVKKQWSLEEEEADLKSFDIGLMPLSDDLWSRGKCGLKILQYQSVGIPVVCTPVGVNRDIVEDGINGFWARSEDEWGDRLLKLIREEELRREMGLKGREMVERNYSVAINGPRIFEIFNKVLSP